MELAVPVAQPVVKRLNPFERYLSLWVGLCMVAGVLLGKSAPALIDGLRRLEFGHDSHVNLPIALLIWLMILPMMMKVDLAAVRSVGRKPRGLAVTLFVNWVVKPFSMALIAWIFFRHVFAPWLTPAEADQYIAGCIILAAAPCTAMVFVWSYLTDGDPAYTLVQVSVNDLIMLFLFAPTVGLLVSGASSLSVPFEVLLYSVVAFIVIPLAAGTTLRTWFVARRGRDWFEQILLPRFAPATILALLATLVLIFAFQADNITGKSLHVALIAVPILLQVYLNAALAYGAMKVLKVEHAVAAPGALIGASNFFELAVATAIALFGPGSGAALATVIGVLVAVGMRRLQPYATLVPAASRVKKGGKGERGKEREWGSEEIMMKKKVLFLCTGNSARSQMAEGLLRHLAGDRFLVASAGTHPAGLNPYAVEAMREIGIDISYHVSERVDTYLGERFDRVITVCDRAKESCPVFPGAPKLLHWSFEDPAAATGTFEERMAVFRKVRDQIERRVREFIEQEAIERSPVSGGG